MFHPRNGYKFNGPIPRLGDLANSNPKKMQTWYHDTDDVSPIFPGLQWFFF
jgi:hypothetical protein